jgi:hypothetical protein
MKGEKQMHGQSRKFNGLGISILAVIALFVIAGGIWSLEGWQHHAAKLPENEYQCVLLANGQVYFGKLSGLNSTYPVLKDVYYVQTEKDSAGKESGQVLLKRGMHEWHRPDKMILNASQIVLVEPVTPNSLVAKRIREFKDTK